jgi:hypothetical protein
MPNILKSANGKKTIRVMETEQSYFDYYDRPIRQDTNGIKLVLGGTGLGKTSGILDVIQHSDTNGRKFIYCANRLQLLNEMAEKLDEKGIAYAYLRKNADVVMKVIRTPQLNEALHILIDSSDFRRVVDDISSGWRKLDIVHLHNAIQMIERIGSSLDGLRSNMLDKLIDDQVRTIINFFRTVLQELKSLDGQAHQNLIRHSIIQELFPYIRYRTEDDVRVLLVTIQKAYLGFFDGFENVNLTKLSNSNGRNIIFLDEYDFLENELIGLICRSEQITRPFRFVEFFYNAMNRHKLPALEYPTLPNASTDLRKRLENIMGIIETLRDKGITFPDINQFTCRLDDKKGFIFQTSRSLIMDSLYLRQTDRSFDIVRERDESNIHALQLFRAVRHATAQIMFLFKELETQAPTVYQELLRQCYQDTDYYRLVERITQLPRYQNPQQTRFDHLLEEGYGLYEITELNQTTDPDEVEFNYLTISTTPERILVGLAKNNLVFGLSATADIPRLVRNFNEDWLRKQEGLNYIEVEQEDVDLITALNEAKQSDRDNSVQVLKAKTLDDYHRDDIRVFIKAIAREHGFGGDDKNGVRRERVESFFATLLWILETRSPEELQEDTHLLFFSTFRQIKYIFSQYGRWTDEWLNIVPLDSNYLFNIYRLGFEGSEFIVVLYDADQARNIQSDDQAKAQYDEIFWRGVPVITITQYASAGNGVNLQYYLSEEHKQQEIETDYRNIHLLDAPYFFFGRTDFQNNTVDENTAVTKENIWYLAKLFEGQIITRNQFETALRRVHSDAGLNAKYHKEWATQGGESVYNRLAALIQALGRIERVWKRMPNQTVVFNRDVWQIFQLFCTRPQFEDVFRSRMSIVSSNLRAIFEQILEQYPVDEKMVRRYREEGLATKNDKCKERVGELLIRLRELRAGSQDLEAREDWTNLRQAALRHDLNASILKDYRCLFKAEYSHFRHGKLYIDRDLNILPFSHPFGEGVHQWNLDGVYWQVASNTLLRTYFEQHDYELGFSSAAQKFFTPYFYQAVLVGAIGEAAVESILSSLKVAVTADLPDELFEIADLQIEGTAWYIDCKNYTERTLDNFHVSPDDPAWRAKLNEEDFKALARNKLRTITNFHEDGIDCKLLYLNLSSSDDWKLVYFDSSFEEVPTFEEAKIVVLPGILVHGNPNSYTDAFKKLIEEIRNSLVV